MTATATVTLAAKDPRCYGCGDPKRWGEGKLCVECWANSAPKHVQAKDWPPTPSPNPNPWDEP